LLPAEVRRDAAGYDTLEFKMVRSYVNGQTVNSRCEGVVVDRQSIALDVELMRSVFE